MNQPIIRRVVAALSCCCVIGAASAQVDTDAAHPNILWISCEDMSPDLPMYGDNTVQTPNLSALAAAGTVYTRAFSSSPVCSTSRSAIITGMYATTIGTHQHRSMVQLPEGLHCFPAYLRDAGYYCTNNSKTDYNFAVPEDAWDESSKKAHWRNRPRKDQPFFAVFNLTVTHESMFMQNEKEFAQRTPDIPDRARTTTESVKLPPYIPDTPITRHDWARYYDAIMEMDFQAGQILNELKQDGLATNTIVMFFSDHGEGLPRGKRWLYDSGIHVPLIIHQPGQDKAGSRNEELVSLLDLGPTVLSLAGVDGNPDMQGRIFMGREKQPEPEYLFQTRDRMDEQHDMIRSVRDHRYKYIKNFYPERPYDLKLIYLEKNPTMQEMRRLHKAGKLSGPMAQYFQKSKPPEEFYDTQTDPFEIHNLVAEPEYADRLKQMREALVRWQKETGDKGLEPEPESQKRGAAAKNSRHK